MVRKGRPNLDHSKLLRNPEGIRQTKRPLVGMHTMGSIRHWINHHPVDYILSVKKTNCDINWIEIYPIDSVIHPLNNWGQLAIYRSGQEKALKLASRTNRHKHHTTQKIFAHLADIYCFKTPQNTFMIILISLFRVD